MKKRLIFEVEEGFTECGPDCPFYLIGYHDCEYYKRKNFFDCDEFNLSTLKLIENEENTKV